jgi:hypothetical protein
MGPVGVVAVGSPKPITEVGKAERLVSGQRPPPLDATVMTSAPIASRCFTGKLFQRTAAGASEMIV